VNVKTHKHGQQDYGNQDSMASIITGLCAGQSVVQFLLGTRDLYVLKMSRLAPGSTQPPIQWFPRIPSPIITFRV
jgi:hypothetical protein